LLKGVSEAKRRIRQEHFTDYENGEPVDKRDSQENKIPRHMKQEMQLQWNLHLSLLWGPVDLNFKLSEILSGEKFVLKL
jgi:hypothetical protein